MEKFLIEKISKITDEERQLLSGTRLQAHRYSHGDDLSVVTTEKISKKPGDITVRTHTRYADFPLHKHNYLEMMIVLGGSVTHIIDGEEITLHKGDILVMNKHVAHSIKMADTPDIGVNIIISDSFAESLLAELSDTVFATLAKENSKNEGVGIYICFSTGENKQIENIIENMLFELTEYTTDIKVLRGTVGLLFDYLSLKSDKMMTKTNLSPGKDEERKKQIIAYIKENYQKASLENLSERLFLTPPYLSSLISKYFGCGFKQLLLSERINKAEELFIKSDLTIGEIINRVGYENQSYFHKEYKKAKGKSPLATRKAAKA